MRYMTNRALPAWVAIFVILLVVLTLHLPTRFAPGVEMALLALTAITALISSRQEMTYLALSLFVRMLVALIVMEIVIKFYPTRDAVGYNIDGLNAMSLLKDGRFSEFLRIKYLGGGGTTFYKKMTGVLFLLFGPNEVSVRVLNTFVAWGGSLLFFRGFSKGMSLSQRSLFAIILLFTPSVLLWTSIHGKDPWMFFSVCALSWVAINTVRTGVPTLSGLIITLFATFLAYFMRPHIVMLLATSLFVVVLFVKGPGRLPIGFLALAIAYLSYATFVKWIGVESVGSVQELIQAGRAHYEHIVNAGGSFYELPGFLKPFAVLAAPVLVYLIPLPFQARNPFALYTSLEQLLLFALFLLGLAKMARWHRKVFRKPEILLSLSYLVLFAVLFIFSGNAGLLARQRASQALPFLAYIASFAAISKEDRDEGS